MLVLTRKQQQKIQIGDNIIVTVLRVKGQAVRIGIEAPEGVRILRTEIIPQARPDAEPDSSVAPMTSAALGEEEAAGDDDLSDVPARPRTPRRRSRRAPLLAR